MKISIQSFQGIAPKVNPRYLNNGAAQIALDVEAFGQALKPLNSPGAALKTLPKSGVLSSLYRYGQDTAGELDYWFHWPYPVDVCRSQIAGDASEWTFYTDYDATANPNGYPKATYNDLALAGETEDYPVGWRRLGLPAPTANLTMSATQPTPEGFAATVTITSTQLATMTSGYGVSVTVDNGATILNCTLTMNAPTASQAKAAIDAVASSLVTTAVDGSNLTVTSVTAGEGVVLIVRWADTSTGYVSGNGYNADLGTMETRTYTYTWIATESGLTMESAPQSSDNMNTVDVYPGGTVTLGGFGTAPTTDGYLATGVRIYRATEGVFLYVGEATLAELAAAGNTFVDDVAAEALGEALPSTTWTKPPDKLQGMINLPNGMMAGFVGRDVHFAEPYRPYAWPDTYMQTVDFPVVGLGRIDTTLVVLTTGVPYLMQGSAPELVTVVKSDLEQACVSKRSIVSMGGAVYYASPDGLVKLSVDGSQMLTEALFGRAQWQMLNPSTIHAYGHDNRYIAFYTLSDGTKGGFVLDLLSGLVVLHTIGAGSEADITAGYVDLRNDQLYLVNSNRQLVKWSAGAARTGKWRTKVFGLPQITGFSCAQVEAQSLVDGVGNVISAYPNGQNARVYCDGVLIRTQALTERTPFRLPPVQGRDWEVELDVKSEIFNLAIAQSMSEIAST